ncbi:hypothetical protein CBER1_02540 [Cercospora berteroae]|uniref:Protein Asterix n=1 Tax=Cercospora berteroae TaxID=357750 RepID=A0A2S6C442_9PEZI|nr:hypothetical protein CBER1_02540 [Cercospora berteroae]
MASKKDMRRPDLIVPYQPPEKDEGSTDFQSTMTSTLPMAAIFTRNKLLGWTAVLFSLQSWLTETPAQKAASSSPAYLSVGMAIMSLGVGTCWTPSPNFFTTPSSGDRKRGPAIPPAFAFLS